MATEAYNPHNPDCRDLSTRELLLDYIKERYEHHLYWADRSTGSFREQWLSTARELKRLLEEAEGTYSHAKGAQLDRR